MKIDKLLNTQQGFQVTKKDEKISSNSADFAQLLERTLASNKTTAIQSNRPIDIPQNASFTSEQEAAIMAGYDLLNILANLEDTLAKIVPGMEKRLDYLGRDLIKRGEDMISLRDSLSNDDELRKIVNEIGTLSVTEGYKLLKR